MGVVEYRAKLEELRLKRGRAKLVRSVRFQDVTALHRIEQHTRDTGPVLWWRFVDREYRDGPATDLMFHPAEHWTHFSLMPHVRLDDEV